MNTIFSTQCTTFIAQLLQKAGYTLENTQVIIANNTPSLDKGDIAYPMFPITAAIKKQLNKQVNPVELAQTLVSLSEKETFNAKLEAQGPYVNIFLDRAKSLAHIVTQVLEKTDNFGKSNILENQKIMIEFSGPNTNKPLHLGHLRNDALGESMARLLQFCGADVKKVNIVNDRGVHICKSMLAYKKFGNGSTPESENKKSDHFVGEYYVKYAQWEKENPNAEKEVRTMLIDWENGDLETCNLWKQMNEWAINGISETYKKTGISFDTIYRESDTYLVGKKYVEQGLKEGVFYRQEDGSVWIDLEDVNLDKKLVLRADGTSVYITQDLGLANMRYADWKFDNIIYVVAREQNYHFKVLFHILEKLNFTPAKNKSMHHLEYGMVHLPDGRMKSREGTVVDADDLLQNIANMVKKEIQSRERETHVQDVNKVSFNVALGALHYYLLSVGAKKDVVFNPETSIAFHGNTGPYLQYTCARISSILRKFDIPQTSEAWDVCTSDAEWIVGLELSRFQEAVEQACVKHDPSILAKYLYDCANAFASLYQSTPIATSEDEGVKASRMKMAQALVQVLKNGLHLLNIPFIKEM